MSVTAYDDIHDFINKAQGYLDSAQIENNLILSKGVEANLPAHEQVKKPDKAMSRIRGGRFFYWAVAGKPVSIAGFAPVTRDGVRIGPVYTPPQERGKGYASACVAQISRYVMGKGLWCCLFTDSENPTSNKIYKNVGYSEFCRYQEYNLPRS